MRREQESPLSAKNIRFTDMKLSNKNISATVDDIRAFFEKSGSARKDILKICLSMEEILLRYQMHFGSAHEFDVYKKNWFGMPRVIIRIAGEPFYPPHHSSKNDIKPAEMILSDEIMSRLLNYPSGRMSYRYESRFNEINFFSTKERKPIKIPGGSITIAIFLAMICSFLIGFFPQEVQNILITDITAPLLSTLMSLIVTVTIFMVFFSIVASICAIDDSTTLENIGATVIGRFFLLYLIMIAITMAVSEIFCPVVSISGGGSLEISKIVELLLSIVPTNIISAFSEANILQVTVIAFVTGICVIMLGNRASNLKNMLIDINMLVFKITAVVLKVIPLTIFLCIFKTLSTSHFSDFFVVWKMIAAGCIAYAIFLAFMLIRLSIKSEISISNFLKKIFPAFFITLTTASSIAALPKSLETATNEFHIEEKFCSFWMPLAVALFSSSVVFKMVAAAFYATEVSGGTISIMQLFIIAFFAIQFGISTPKVSGGITASYSLMLTQLGLPTELLGSLMIANVLIGNLFTALKVVVQNCELISVAQKLNFIKAN